jgi:hypothetical protein
MKTTILLSVMTVALATGSAMARKPLPPPPYTEGQSVYCATREAGNPHSKYCDYLAWSGWRRRGSWDASLDNACMMNPYFVPAECGRRASR